MSREINAVSINLDWPIKLFHNLYKFILHYAKRYTNWIPISDHYPENKLNKSENKVHRHYADIICRIKYGFYYETIRFNVPMVKYMVFK